MKRTNITPNEIIKEIESNGGLDLHHMRYLAKQDGVSLREYFVNYIKLSYGVHGHTAAAVYRNYC